MDGLFPSAVVPPARMEDDRSAPLKRGHDPARVRYDLHGPESSPSITAIRKEVGASGRRSPAAVTSRRDLGLRPPSVGRGPGRSAAAGSPALADAQVPSPRLDKLVHKRWMHGTFASLDARLSKLRSCSRTITWSPVNPCNVDFTFICSSSGNHFCFIC